MLILKSKLVNFFQRKTILNIHLSIDREEVDDEKLAEIMQTVGTYGYFTFSPDHLKKEVEDIMKNKKIGVRTSGYSHSQVLRGKIRLLWEKDQSDKGELSFDEYYDYWMNKVISHFESKIAKS